MEEQYQNMVIGFIALILIFNTMAIFTLISDNSQCNSLNPVNTTVASSPETKNTILSAVPPAITITPPVETATPSPTPTPVPARKGYMNIFYMPDANLDTSLPPISLNLLNPPLIIYFDVKPNEITESMPEDYKLLDTQYHVLVNITRPYEGAKFLIKVTNNDTERVVAENGYGEVFGLQTPQTIVIRDRGNYTICISGMYVNATIAMEVPRERNFPFIMSGYTNTGTTSVDSSTITGSTGGTVAQTVTTGPPVPTTQVTAATTNPVIINQAASIMTSVTEKITISPSPSSA